MIRVAYQTLREITWGKETEKLAGRTLEEMFALENLVWCQDPLRKNLNLYIKDLNTIEDLNTPISLSAMHEALYEKVKNNNFKKTEFALNLIMQSKDINKVEWHVPYYIKEGLEWLQIQLQNNDSADLPSDDSNDIAYGEIS